MNFDKMEIWTGREAKRQYLSKRIVLTMREIPEERMSISKTIGHRYFGSPRKYCQIKSIGKATVPIVYFWRRLKSRVLLVYRFLREMKKYVVNADRKNAEYSSRNMIGLNYASSPMSTNENVLYLWNILFTIFFGRIF